MTMMLVPSTRSMINSIMSDPFDAFFGTPSHRATVPPTMMRTDIKETDQNFELAIDLPGFSKEDVAVDLKDGYLSINAKTSKESEDKDEKGTYVRKERFSGTCSRTFYVGEDIEEDAITAKFENGVLTIDVPKKQEQPKLESGRSIAIA